MSAKSAGERTKTILNRCADGAIFWGTFLYDSNSIVVYSFIAASWMGVFFDGETWVSVFFRTFEFFDTMHAITCRSTTKRSSSFSVSIITFSSFTPPINTAIIQNDLGLFGVLYLRFHTVRSV